MTAPPAATTGHFISLEGIDGSGKSTQARRLADTLRAEGHDVVLTREPGGAPGAEAIRELLVTGDGARWSAVAELLLFNAARRDHLENTIWPALAAGRVVVCDRFADSTRVYQGVARAPLGDLVERLHRLVIGTDPDLTVIIDTDPETALARGRARGGTEDRFERFGLPFQQALRDGFATLARDNPDRCRIVDGNRAPDAVAADVAALAAAALGPGNAA